MKKQKLHIKVFLTSLALALPMFGGVYVINSSADADLATNYSSNYSSFTNSSFNDSTASSYYSNDVSGWTRNFADGRATTMIIDTEYNYSNLYKSTYHLTKNDPENDGKYVAVANPGNIGPEKDNKILMINSALKENQTNGYTHEGYNSKSYSFEANSYYYVQVAMKTTSLNGLNEFGSVYLNGLKDADGNEITVAFEKQKASDWTNFSFFVSTGSEKQDFSLGLWLGSKNTSSYGVAFFDQVLVKEFSKNLFYETIYQNNSGFVNSGVYDSVQDVTSSSKLVELSKDATLDYSTQNFDFEDDMTSPLPKWELDTQNTSVSGHARVLNNLSSSSFETTTTYSAPGNNFDNENTQSLVLWTTDEGSAYVTSPEIEIKSNAFYKISFDLKTSLEKGSFFVKAQEQETLFDHYNTNIPNLRDYYKLHSATSSAISSGNKASTNNYEKISFYVQGGNFYDSSIKLSFGIGNDQTEALGFAVVDNVTVEYCTKSEFTDATNKLSLAQTEGSTKPSNGYFNFVDGSSKTLTYPLAPQGFTISKSDEKMLGGIINTYEDNFNSYTEFGSILNPAKLSGAPDDEKTPNNILMFYNPYPGYQTIKNSTAVDLEKGSYYNLSFDFANYSSTFDIEIVNDQDIVLFYDKDVKSEGEWNKYSAKIYVGTSSEKITIKVHFGTSDSKTIGYGFIDNMLVESSTESAFASSDKKIDLSNFLLNLNPFGTVGSTLSDHSAFSGNLTAGNDGEGGVVIGNNNDCYSDQNNDPIYKDQDLKNNVLVVGVGKNSTYTLKSKFTLDVKSDSYYKLTFKLLTNYMPKQSDLPSTDDEGNAIEYNYGVSVGMTGFEKATKLQSNDGWTNYTIYFKSTSDQSINFEYSLISDNKYTSGISFLTDINWEESTESDFELYQNSSENGKQIFTLSTTAEKETDNEEEKEDTQTTAQSDDFNWLLIPTLIMALAVVIAVVGALIRKIQSGKKQQVTKPSEKYDRKETLDKTVVKTEALKQRNAEAKSLEAKIKELKDEIDQLDKAHNEYIKEARKENNGKITKQIERQFKLYASKHGKLVEQLTLTKEKLQTINSPEYLISLEKKASKTVATKIKK